MAPPRMTSALGQQLQAAFQLHAQGRAADAEAAARRILKIAPKEPNALYLLGVLAHQAGDAKAAAQHFEKSYKADRNSVAALAGLGIVRLDQQRYGEAKGLFEKALALQPGDPSLLNNLGLAQKGAGGLDAAAESFRAAVAANPDYSTAVANFADALRGLGRDAEAERALRDALRRAPEDGALNAGLGGMLASAGDMDGALERFETAYRALQGRVDPEVHRNYANVLIYKGRLDQAEALLRDAAGAYPDEVLTLVDLADLLRSRGDPARKEEAQALYRRAAEIGGGLAKPSPMALHRTAAALERLGRHRDSFRAQQRAQAAWREAAARIGKRYDRAAMEREAGRIRAVFEGAPKADPQIADRRLLSDKPIFIVGMPRSGTTLAEQILASHPAVTGAGELPTIPALVQRLQEATGRPWPEAAAHMTPQLADELAQGYLATLPADAADTPHCTDKLPPNFWYVGFIRRLFPGARILHTLRHPLDVGLSIFSQRFGHDLLYDHDLEDIGHYYRLYWDLITFWRRWDPEIETLVYEEMVADQAGETRRLLERLDLPWDERVLAFHETERDVVTASYLQVRQPIYQGSVQKWRRYEAELQPLADALGDLADYEATLAGLDR
eukprot:g14134.t1